MQKFSNKLIAVDNLLFYYLNSLTRNDIIDKFFLLITHNTRLADVKHLVVPFESYSFPSGHTTASFAAAFILSFALPQLSILFIFTASLVGAARIYLGVHYPSDILIGIITAIIFSFAVHNLFIL
ncbi:PAP2 superfamily protein [Halanaerobium saccharolyticum]|uniref:PAP2 superfamily protein n=1 Tax=Halanaerobium saccharolyticum TaxID=43595 RepID=A0A4R6LIA4_9FIRM|nr:phosphatase PAP2 family protein [Halanaerobium saccharolyticum]TDO83367.1 PAP2 superfamily protein [Halanaerobium saccharolyticum]